jgi:hypothetical protein
MFFWVSYLSSYIPCVLSPYHVTKVQSLAVFALDLKSAYEGKHMIFGLLGLANLAVAYTFVLSKCTDLYLRTLSWTWNYKRDESNVLMDANTLNQWEKAICIWVNTVKAIFRTLSVGIFCVHVQSKRLTRCWEYSWVAECILCMCEILASIPAQQRKREKRKKDKDTHQMFLVVDGQEGLFIFISYTCNLKSFFNEDISYFTKILFFLQ